MIHNRFLESTVPYAQDLQKFHIGREGAYLWTNGLICAFELVRESSYTTTEKHSPRDQPIHQSDDQKLRKQVSRTIPSHPPSQSLNDNSTLRGFPYLWDFASSPTAVGSTDGHYADCHWIPIGWARIVELLQIFPIDAKWSSQHLALEDEDDFHATGVVDPSWQCPEGPIWWCHVFGGHPSIIKWLRNAHWLHPDVSTALRDKSRLINECLQYEVPVRMAGGLLFELLSQLFDHPSFTEDYIPIVIRFWQTQKFLITVMHVEASALNINALGITEMQKLLLAGESATPKSVHEVITYLIYHISRWDDRLLRKFVFGVANKIELEFINRRNYVDLNLHSMILNQEIKRLAKQVIRVKWLLHAREEIVFELLKHLQGNATRILLDGLIKGTREMLEEQEVVHRRLFAFENTIRAWLEDKSPRIAHNLVILGGCGLILSIMTSLFGINVYAFAILIGVIFFIGITREMLAEQEVVRGWLFTFKNTICALLEDKSPRITHILGILGGCGLISSIITSIFGINEYAFAFFIGVTFFIEIFLAGRGMYYHWLKKLTKEEDIILGLQRRLSTYKHDAKTQNL